MFWTVFLVSFLDHRWILSLLGKGTFSQCEQGKFHPLNTWERFSSLSFPPLFHIGPNHFLPQPQTSHLRDILFGPGLSRILTITAGIYFPNIKFSVTAEVMKIVHSTSCFYLNSGKQRILLLLLLFI